jgi:hypothetical protein
MEQGYNLKGQTRTTHWKAGLLITSLALAVDWLMLAGCGAAESTPTLVPTLVLPTPSVTASLAPAAARPTPTLFATGFPTWRKVTLSDHESFDFRQETTGVITEGDLYYSAFSAQQGTACFWAENEEQVGGRDLGSWPLTALTDRPLPRDRYSRQCIPVIRGHVYVYGLRGDERLAVFRVADTGPDWVAIEYILRE